MAEHQCDQVEVRRRIAIHRALVTALRTVPATDVHQRGAQPCAIYARTLFSLLPASLSNFVAAAMLAVGVANSECCSRRISVAFATLASISKIDFCTASIRVSVASERMSQHFRLILGLDEAQDAAGLLVAAFTLLSLEYAQHLVDTPIVDRQPVNAVL